MKYLPLAFFLFFTVITVAPSNAQVLEKKEVYTILDPAGLEAIFTSENITFEKSDDQQNTYDIVIDGYNAFAAISEDGDLFLTSYFEGNGTTIEQINSYNASHRWGRLYLDSEGDIAIQTELSFTGGIHRDNIIIHINTFVSILDNVNNEF